MPRSLHQLFLATKLYVLILTYIHRAFVMCVHCCLHSTDCLYSVSGPRLLLVNNEYNIVTVYSVECGGGMGLSHEHVSCGEDDVFIVCRSSGVIFPSNTLLGVQVFLEP